MARIVSVNEPAPPTFAPRPVGPVALTTPTEGVPRVYVLPDALDTIRRHIGWGTTTRENVAEQGGLLIGRLHLDAATEAAFCVVGHALAARPSQSSAVFIEMNHATWADLYRRFYELAAPAGSPPWRIVGWYHTHPNELGVFMSGTDRRTQSDFFPGAEHFAFVFNPHRHLWKAFQGAACVECAAVGLAAPDEAGEAKPSRAPASEAAAEAAPGGADAGEAAP
jgi:proteasome lid subunit RPN8/RPN11